ncbi:MTH1187 family thiamine-binding protein [Ectothiorhodospiraceae bacterium WFHF3C12]|nr:MTH1187 family thiamine-binding protein [Ectothiorhodospiraceae bacterium WFHF3C12]
MRVVAEISLIPVGVGVHLSEYIAECHRVFQDAGLQVELHANGTNIEGEWDDVLQAMKRCHERVHELGAPRIVSNIKLGTRTDREQGLGDTVQRVRQRLP